LKNERLLGLCRFGNIADPSKASCTLTYFAMSTDLPLKDASLLAWDRAFGLDFRSYLQLINSHRSIMRVLASFWVPHGQQR